MDMLLVLAVFALAPLGASAAMAEGMLLHPLSRLFASLPVWLQKPLHTCRYCMTSTWGTAAVLLLGLPFEPWQWPVLVLCAIGLQDVFYR